MNSVGDQRERVRYEGREWKGEGQIMEGREEKERNIAQESEKEGEGGREKG